MRVTIIKENGFVSIDDLGFSGIDLSFLPENLHAVQWYDTVGEVEMREPHPYKILMAPSKTIDTLDEYQKCLDLWALKKVEYEAELVANEMKKQAELAAFQAANP